VLARTRRRPSKANSRCPKAFCPATMAQRQTPLGNPGRIEAWGNDPIQVSSRFGSATGSRADKQIEARHPF
jgi:hypothetical protein